MVGTSLNWFNSYLRNLSVPLVAVYRLGPGRSVSEECAEGTVTISSRLSLYPIPQDVWLTNQKFHLQLYSKLIEDISYYYRETVIEKKIINKNFPKM